MGLSRFSPGCPCCSGTSCTSTDLLIMTCNANRVTDDPYTIYLNGTEICDVPTINTCPPACCSPADGAWIVTDSSITPTSITNISMMGSCGGFQGYCQACIDDNVFSCNTTIDVSSLLASNELVLTATANAGCGNWGMVGVWGLYQSSEGQWTVCQTLLCSSYSSLYTSDYPFNIFDQTFLWGTTTSAFSPAFSTGFGGGLGFAAINPQRAKLLQRLKELQKPCCDKKRGKVR